MVECNPICYNSSKFTADLIFRRPFTLDQLDNAEAHLTALQNNKDGSPASARLSGSDFIPIFEEQYSNQDWKDVTVSRLSVSVFTRAANSIDF